MSSKKERFFNAKAPLKVKVISILGMVLSAIVAIFLVWCLFGDVKFYYTTSTRHAPMILFVPIYLFIISMFIALFFVFFNLGKLKNWARIIILVLAVLQVLSSFPFFSSGETFILGLIPIIIGGYIVWCLGFDKEVEKAF